MKKGGGIIKFEAWEYENKIVKYNIVYINKNIFSNDNGRVMGYDNIHSFHHKHYFGQITELDDFFNSALQTAKQIDNQEKIIPKHTIWMEINE